MAVPRSQTPHRRKRNVKFPRSSVVAWSPDHATLLTEGFLFSLPLVPKLPLWSRALVVAWSPDHATLPTEGLILFLKFPNSRCGHARLTFVGPDLSPKRQLRIPAVSFTTTPQHKSIRMSLHSRPQPSRHFRPNFMGLSRFFPLTTAMPAPNG
jgi:hypothetical protein